MTYAIEQVEDSWQYIKGLPEGCVDHVMTDPPFNAKVQDNLIHGTAFKKFVDGGGGGGVPKRKLAFPPLPAPDPAHGHMWARDLVRLARRWVLIHCAVEDFGEIKRACPDEYVRGCIWYKPNAQGQMTGDRPASCYEGIALLHRDAAKRWNGVGSYAMWSAADEAFWPCNSTRGEGKRPGDLPRHPNQKPLDLCLKLVSLFSDRGETIIDPFCGGGRLGEACVSLERDYIGLDFSPEWVEVAKLRLARATARTDEEALTLCRLRKVDIVEGP